MTLIKLHYPKDKKHKNIENREVFVNEDKIRLIRRKSTAEGGSQTEIWFDSKDCIIVTEMPDEINSMIKYGFQDKNTGECIKFKKDFDENEYEDFIKREG